MSQFLDNIDIQEEEDNKNNDNEAEDQDKDKEEKEGDKDEDQDQDKNQFLDDINIKTKIDMKMKINMKTKIDMKMKIKKKTKVKKKKKIKDKNNRPQVYYSMMMKFMYDVSRINKELLRFLEYTHSGHRSDDLIPLALVQAFRDVIFMDIVMSQQEIHDIFDQYKTCDGTIVPITTGQRLNFAIAVLYGQYRYSCIKADKNAYHPSKWTKQE